MKKLLKTASFLLAILILQTACMEDNSPETEEDISLGTETNGKDQQEENKNDPMEEGKPKLLLTAQASPSSAYTIIQTQGFDYESPSQNNGSAGNAHRNQPHILQQYDPALQKNVFAFVMHHAADRNATGDWTRQRVEIKIDHRAGSQGHDFCGLEGEEGRSFIHRWKFKLPADFAVSDQFTHLHQIKNEGGSFASQPIVVLSARKVNGEERMRLTYYTSDSSGNTSTQWINDSSSNIGLYRGHWVQCEETITYSSEPSAAAYSIKITRISDDQVLMDFTAPEGVITWRTGNTHGRPKFGLYRRIFTGTNPGNFTEPPAANTVPGLKDETVLFADFEIVRLK